MYIKKWRGKAWLLDKYYLAIWWSTVLYDLCFVYFIIAHQVLGILYAVAQVKSGLWVHPVCPNTQEWLKAFLTFYVDLK